MSAPARIPEGFIDELMARIRPSDVIGRKVKLTKKGKEWVGLSPFTNEKTPSFYVNDQKRIFKCFSSGLGGSVITFVMETERLSFIEAVEKLAEEAGMQLPRATQQDVEIYDQKKRLEAVCEAAAKFFQDRLQSVEGAGARAYLEKRGLKPAAWKRHRLGYSPDDWRRTYAHLKEQGFTKEEILEAGLARESEKSGEPYDAFRGRLMFPIEDVRGHVIAFGGRGLTPDATPKYLNSGDTPLFQKSRILYRYRLAREALGASDLEGLIVCEGYMDAIALAEAGFAHSVAPLGTAFTEEQLHLIWRAGPLPLLCFDGDRAGLAAAYRAIDRALPEVEPGKSVAFVLLPDGLDPDDLIRAQGAQAMAELLAAPIPLSEMLWRRERDAELLDTPERQAGLENRLMDAARRVRHQGVRAAYERDLKARLREHLWGLRNAKRDTGLRRYQTGQARPGPRTGLAHSPFSGDDAQAILKKGPALKIRGLGAVVQAIDSPALLEEGAEILAACQFPDPDVARLRDALLDLANAGKPIDRGTIRAHLGSSGHSRALRLLIDYPPTGPVLADAPEAREWLIALEQYVAAGVSGGESEAFGTDDASRDAAASPSAWRRHHKQVAERRALRTRLKDVSGGGSGER